ncbi:hypothetical protein OROMI_006640 [Orobanche minor]
MGSGGLPGFHLLNFKSPVAIRGGTNKNQRANVPVASVKESVAPFKKPDSGSSNPSSVVSGPHGGRSDLCDGQKANHGSPNPCAASPISVADLRGVVSEEVWARFPEAVWNDAAVIASEILKYSPSDVSPTTPPPVPPVVSAPVVALVNGQKPANPTSFADAVKGNSDADPVAVDGQETEGPIGLTDFSGSVPTAIFSKEDAAQ